jgi:hypothetical protein
MMFENRMLRRMFRPKRDEDAGFWMKLHNEEPHNLYSSPSVIINMKSRKMRWPENGARMRRGINIEYLCGKLEGRRPLRRPRRRCADKSKMDLRVKEWGRMDWIDLVPDRDHWRALVNTVMNHRVPYNAVKFLSRCTINGLSRMTHLHEVS